MATENNPESFYIASSDKRGHREQLRATHVTPGLHGAMAVVLGSGVFPYKTFGDIQRDSLHKTVYALLDKLEDEEYVAEAKRLLNVDRVIAKAEAKDKALASQREMVDLVIKQFTDQQYRGFDGIDTEPLRDAYNSITFNSVQFDFESRIRGMGIDPSELNDEE